MGIFKMSKKFKFLTSIFLVTFLIVPACNTAHQDNGLTPTKTLPLEQNSTLTATAVPTSTIDRQPFIEVQPENAPGDEVVKIQVGGMVSGQPVTVKAALKDDLDQLWESQATFLADENGMVDVSSQAPLSGTYQLADPMGLFWSMRPNVPRVEDPIFIHINTDSILITFTVQIEGDQTATTTINRIRQPEDIKTVSLAEDGLVGQFYIPGGEGPYPTLIILGGSGGGVSLEKAIMLASHGYATLALAYFGVPPLPEALSEIPLEYFETAIGWLKSQEVVNEDRIGVLGTSRGGELALLLGATFSDLRAAVGYVPSGVVMRNTPTTLLGERSAWTYQGNPIPFANNYVGVASLKTAAIPVEKINGPILLISGRDDQVWPSTRLSEVAIGRLEEHNHPYPYEHLIYEDAGHLIAVPYWPAPSERGVQPMTGAKLVFGGTARGNAAASADAWAHVLDFLEEHLKNSMP